MSLAGQLIEGINDAGVYAGILYLPGKTVYPTFDPSIGRKALGTLDLVNYILGTSSSVVDAVNKLSNIQIVLNATFLGVAFYSAPIHIFIKDKSGDGAVIEFIDKKVIIYHDKDIDVLTNAPAYDWQINNYNRISQQFKDYNTDYKTDGVYANGSGYIGLPGDATSSSRFVRLKTLLKALPVSKADNHAYYGITTLSNSIIAPIGMTPSPTIWYSKFNLGNGDYDIFDLIVLAVPGHFVPNPEIHSTPYKHYNVNNIEQIGDQTILKYPPPDMREEDIKKVKPFPVPQEGTSYYAEY